MSDEAAAPSTPSTPTITEPHPGPGGHQNADVSYRDKPEDRERANAKAKEAKAGKDPVADAGSTDDPDGPLKPIVPIDQALPQGKERGPDGKFLAKDPAAPKAEPTPSATELAAEAGAQAAGIAPPPPPPQKWKLGDAEFGSPDELYQAAQRLQHERDQATAYKRFVEEAAAERNKARALEQQLKTDPMAALRAMGLNPRELAIAEVRAAMEEEKKYAGMTPEQIQMVQRMEAAESKAAQVQAAWDQEKQSRQQQALKLYTDAKAQEYISQINRAFELEPTLPRTGATQNRLIDEMKRNLRVGYKIPVEQLAKKVAADLQAEHATWDTDDRFNPEAYAAKYPGRVEKLRAVWVKQMQAGQPTGNPAVQGGGNVVPLSQASGRTPDQKRSLYLTPEEANAEINKRIGRK